VTAALTVDRVLGWDPAALSTAANGLDDIAASVDGARRRLETAGDSLSSSWEGPAATAAQQRISREVRTATELADAVRAARNALRSGSADMGAARSAVATAVGDAAAQGFTVRGDGAVIPPPVPPVMTTPEKAAEAQAEIDREMKRRQAEAERIAGVVGDALTEAARADQRTAQELDGVKVPQGLRERVDTFLAQLKDSKDVYAALGSVGGLVAGGKALKDAWKLFGRGKSYTSFLRNALGAAKLYGPAVRFVTGAGTAADTAAFIRMGQLLKQMDNAKDVFRFGVPPKGGPLAGLRTVAGRAFLPLTAISGAMDVFTGGGYDGARGWATRAFGAAGLAGSGAIMLGLASNPIGWAVAGGAVLAYGAWSLGNFVYDNWDNITEFAGKAADWTGERLSEARDWAGDRLSDARDWASDRLSDARDAVQGVTDRVGGLIQGARDLLPDVSIF
jgi:uncharacterized protein YukE